MTSDADCPQIIIQQRLLSTCACAAGQACKHLFAGNSGEMGHEEALWAGIDAQL